MTKAIFQYDKGLMFDCVNHAGDHDVCTIVSTLCGVLVIACKRFDKDFEPTIYNEGHVRIDVSRADDSLKEVFRTVEAVMKQAAKQHPDYIKIY